VLDSSPINDELLADLLQFENDPLQFAYYAFPWGEVDTPLAKYTSLEPWQEQILKDIRDGMLSVEEAIVRISVRSGHGIGKSALICIVILWAMLKPDTRGVVTANTERQLRTKTWAELGKWYNMYIGKELYKLSATALVSADKSKQLTWRIDMIPWSEDNSTAFAGLHNQGGRLLLIFDEGSEIPKIIYEVARGALSDANTQIIWLVFGNPTLNTGEFYNMHQKSEDNPWICYAVDSRQVSFTNKKELERQIRVEGIDSDIVKIRILGEFPSQGMAEFLSSVMIAEAMAREDPEDPREELNIPVVIGVDVARYGTNYSVLYPRRGRNGRLPYEKYSKINTMELVDKIIAMMALYRTNLVAVDGGGVGGGVLDRLRQLGHNPIEVQFGSAATPTAAQSSPDKAKYFNKRAEIWGGIKTWLPHGRLPPGDTELSTELTSPQYTIRNEDTIQLESKETMESRGAVSPDIADALAITFAIPVTNYILNDPAMFGNNQSLVQGLDHNSLEGFVTYM